MRLTRDPKSTHSSSSSSCSWDSPSSHVPAPIVNGKIFPKVYFTLSENDEDVACFSVTPAIMVLSVGLYSSCHNFSRDVKQFRHLFSVQCPGGIGKILALFYQSSFLPPPVHVFPGSHPWPGPDGPPLLALSFALLRTFGSFLGPGSCDPFHKRIIRCFSLFLWYEITRAIT